MPDFSRLAWTVLIGPRLHYARSDGLALRDGFITDVSVGMASNETAHIARLQIHLAGSIRRLDTELAQVAIVVFDALVMAAH